MMLESERSYGSKACAPKRLSDEKLRQHDALNRNAKWAKSEAGKCFHWLLNYPRHVCLPFVDKISLLETIRRQITGGLTKALAYCTWRNQFSPFSPAMNNSVMMFAHS